MSDSPHPSASGATAQAVVLDEPGSHRLVSGPQPLPGPGEVRVAVHSAGVCASDREVYEGTRPTQYVRYPVTPGHEWSGIVDAVGEGVDAGLLGRKTVAEGIRACRRCERCREGATNLCEAGYDESGFTQPGGFSDALVLPAELLHPLPDDADLHAAALLEPAAVASGAVLASGPLPADRVAVIGAGTLGLLTVQLLAAFSPAELMVSDVRVGRAEQALTMGATQACTPEQARERRGRYDLVLEAAGAPDTANEACLLTRRGGRVTLMGAFEPGAQGIDPINLLVSQLTVRSIFGASSSAWSYAVRAFSSGLLDPGSLITHHLPLPQFADAIALMQSSRTDVGKVLLRPQAQLRRENALS